MGGTWDCGLSLLSPPPPLPRYWPKLNSPDLKTKPRSEMCQLSKSDLVLLAETAWYIDFDQESMQEWLRYAEQPGSCRYHTADAPLHHSCRGGPRAFQLCSPWNGAGSGLPPPSSAQYSQQVGSLCTEYCCNQRICFCFALLFTTMIKAATPCDHKEKP